MNTPAAQCGGAPSKGSRPGSAGAIAGARLDETRAFFAFLQTETGALLERWHALRAAARDLDGRERATP